MSARAVLVCHPDPSAAYSAEITYWDTTGQARQAEAELTPCGPLCIGVHSVVRVNVVPNPKAGRERQIATGSGLNRAGEVRP